MFLPIQAHFKATVPRLRPRSWALRHSLPSVASLHAPKRFLVSGHIASAAYSPALSSLDARPFLQLRRLNIECKALREVGPKYHASPLAGHCSFGVQSSSETLAAPRSSRIEAARSTQVPQRRRIRQNSSRPLLPPAFKNPGRKKSRGRLFESRHEYAIAPTTTSRDNRSMYEGESFTLAGRRRKGSARRFSAQSRGTWFATPETSIDTLYSLNFFFGRSCEEC